MNVFASLSSETQSKLPVPSGELAKRYSVQSEIGMGRGPNLYVLDTVESAIEQVQSLMSHKGKMFDPAMGLITFACADAIDERCIAETYLSHRTILIRDGVGSVRADHYDDLHFYDWNIGEGSQVLFEALGNVHEIDIFKALIKSKLPGIDTPRASLLMMKGMNFFEGGNAHGDTTGRNLKIFNKYLPNFLNEVALVFIKANTPALKGVSGFTKIHTGNREIEKMSDLDVYLYQKPE